MYLPAISNLSLQMQQKKFHIFLYTLVFLRNISCLLINLGIASMLLIIQLTPPQKQFPKEHKFI
jgi:hypothetical protein